jgi:hypothetical protein
MKKEEEEEEEVGGDETIKLLHVAPLPAMLRDPWLAQQLAAADPRC